MLIKICGINDLSIAEPLNLLRPDMVGLVFVKKSPRYVTLSQAFNIKKVLENSVKTVAVFQNQPLEEVQKTVSELEIDFVQLHGDESPDYCTKISVPVIKAVSLEKLAKETAEKLELYKKTCKYFLVDRKTQGKGPLVDLDQVRELSTNYNVLLSGGLNPENVSDALSKAGSKIIGLDVSSGVEDLIGKKSISKVNTFIKKVRRYHA